MDNKNNKKQDNAKLKTKSGAKKRFALTGTGKIKRKNAYKSHILTKKETKQKRNLTTTSYVAKVDEKSVQRQLAIK
ncbi:50S ribosomal protein L35 [Chryseobacterium arthrosphaerae]|uniref:Large ribosomal subunit protein bL35 n=1 Tax=Chryseobacterium arthrosphaerae TaxID=651561 RepID=A0A432DUV7_9FLAO|nr:50S ribosomal protein L35 [Chryseobacterium arthrosphaerae]